MWCTKNNRKNFVREPKPWNSMQMCLSSIVKDPTKTKNIIKKKTSSYASIEMKLKKPR